MINRKQLHRVNIQVSIMTGCIVISSSILIFFLTYTLSYQDMIESLQDRVSALYYAVEDQLDKKKFADINEKEDISLPIYKKMQTLLQETKETSGVMYIYTAKALDDGTFIYVVDGLNPNSADFRYPGDLIEPEIQNEMRKALTSKIVMPDKIKDTSWGHIFIAYLPILDDEKIIGVLGIEFDAGHQYETYQSLILGMPLLIIIICLISNFIAFILFRRISNPHHQDLANTDMLTDLKNRNAFDVDMHNFNLKSKIAITLLSIDLDNLKTVNDSKGHHEGDKYIISCVEVLRQAITPSSVLYRIGGDEFAIIMHNKTDTTKELVNRIEVLIKEKNQIIENTISLSVGHATYDTELDSDLISTFQRADINMYNSKRQKKESANLHANRRME